MILCAGEALIDMLPRQTNAGEDAFAPYAGGAVFNTAMALGRLGADASYFGGLSDDLMGDILVRTLKTSKVSTDFCTRVSRPTTLAFVKLVDGQASYAFYDENTAGRMLTPGDLPVLNDSVDALFFGGISLIGEPCGSAYEALMTREAASKVTMIDPNIRTSFITNEDTYRGRLSRMLALADIVKLSDEDMEWLLGPGDIEERAGQILAGGSKLVFITEGGEGARAFTADREIHLKAQTVDVVDTVGAGDTFNAGVLAELSRAGVLNKAAINSISADVVEAALSLGMRSAAITVSRAGANPPWADEL